MSGKCTGCGKPVGGVLGAYSKKLVYGEVCLTCNKKLSGIAGYQLLQPEQIRDIVHNRVSPQSVSVSQPGAPPVYQAASQPDPYPYPQQSSSKSSSATPDEIRKYKQLMDEGFITPEEYEAVKRRLLGL